MAAVIGACGTAAGGRIGGEWHVEAGSSLAGELGLRLELLETRTHGSA